VWCRSRRIGETERFINVHRGRQTGEAAVIEMSGAPVVVVVWLGRRSVRSFSFRCRRWEVVQQTCFRSHTVADHALKITVLILRHILHRKPITSACHKRRGVDDQIAEVRCCGPEAGEKCFGGPEVGGRVFGEGVVVLSVSPRGGGGGSRGSIEALRSRCGTAFEGGVFVEGGVDVVGAF